MLPAVTSPRRVRALGRYRPAPVGVGGDGLGSPRRGGGEGGEKRSNEAAAKQAASSGGAPAASTQPVCARVGFSPPTRPARAAVPVVPDGLPCPGSACASVVGLGWLRDLFIPHRRRKETTADAACRAVGPAVAVRACGGLPATASTCLSARQPKPGEELRTTRALGSLPSTRPRNANVSEV
jgi:hypothetical protein